MSDGWLSLLGLAARGEEKLTLCRLVRLFDLTPHETVLLLREVETR